MSGKIEIIPFDAIIDIQVGGGLYGRLQQICMLRATQKSVEEYTKMLEYFQGGGKPRDDYEYEMEMYFSLLYEIETKAKAQNKLIYKGVEDIPKP